MLPPAHENMELQKDQSLILLNHNTSSPIWALVKRESHRKWGRRGWSERRHLLDKVHKKWRQNLQLWLDIQFRSQRIYWVLSSSSFQISSSRISTSRLPYMRRYRLLRSIKSYTSLLHISHEWFQTDTTSFTHISIFISCFHFRGFSSSPRHFTGVR